MIFRIFRKIMSVVTAVLLVLPLTACSADHTVRDLYEAYVAEKDSLILEKEEKEDGGSGKKPAESAEQVQAAGQTGGALPEKEGDIAEGPGETNPPAEAASREGEMEAPEASAQVLPEKEDTQTAEGDAYLSEEETLPLQETGTEAAADAAPAQEGSPEEPLGSAAFALTPGSGTGQVLVLDEAGTLLTLTARERVYDVTLAGTGAETEDYRHQFAQTFHADVMESGSVINLQARIDSDMPDISISWTNEAGESYTKFISASAKDDVLMLVTVE